MFRTLKRTAAIVMIVTVLTVLTGCAHRLLASTTSFSVGWLVGQLTPTEVQRTCYQNGELIDCDQLPL